MLLDLPVRHGDTAGQDQRPVTPQIVQLMIVDDLEGERLSINDCSTCQVMAASPAAPKASEGKAPQHGHVGHHGRLAEQVVPLVEEADERLRWPGRPGLWSRAGSSTIRPYSNQQSAPRQSRLKAIDSAISSGVVT